MRTAILGAGSLGTVIGALLSKNGCQVDLIDSFKENVDALNKHGAKVTGFMDLIVPIKAYTPDQLSGHYDLVILLTKQTTNKTALAAILPFLHDRSTVCTLQNGIPEEAVAGIVGRPRTVGGTVGFGATWISPGVSELTSTAATVENFAFEIGEMDGQQTDRILQVQKILSLVGKTVILPDLMGVRWSKLLMNATFSGMSAALGCTFGNVLDDHKAMQCLAHVADETVKACHASGYRMVEMNGLNMGRLELANHADIPNKMPLYHQVWDKHRKLKASMLQDLEKGRPCEIDYINGVVAQAGKRLGIKTPFNDKIIELVKEAEARKGVNDFSYLSRFDTLLAAFD